MALFVQKKNFCWLSLNKKIKKRLKQCVILKYLRYCMDMDDPEYEPVYAVATSVDPTLRACLSLEEISLSEVCERIL